MDNRDSPLYMFLMFINFIYFVLYYYNINIFHYLFFSRNNRHGSNLWKNKRKSLTKRNVAKKMYAKTFFLVKYLIRYSKE